MATINLVQALRVELGHNKHNSLLVSFSVTINLFEALRAVSFFLDAKKLGHKLYFRLLLDMITNGLELKSVKIIFLCFQKNIHNTWGLGTQIYEHSTIHLELAVTFTHVLIQ